MAVRPIDAYTLNNALMSWYNDTEDETEKSILRRVMQMVVHAPTLTPPNEALICDGCLWAEMGALEKCSSCMRDKKDNYYRRPPEGEEEP